MDWRVTPPKRVTSPNEGPPPPLKKALKRETSRTSVVTRFMEEMFVFLGSLCFFTAPHFHLGGSWHFSFS